MYKHILIAADFSNCAQQVCDHAKSLAQQYQSQLSICHLVEDYPIADFAYEPMITIDADMRENLLKAGKQHIATFAEALDIPTQNQWVEFGNPRTDIVRIAEDNHVDLIVVGSHGKHGIQLLLGSTANGVLHHAKCDVLAVRLEQNNAN